MKRHPGDYDIARAITDPLMLGAALGPAEPWDRWIAILKAVFALPMSEADKVAFVEVAGGRSPPSRRVDEFWAVVARRSGKTRMAAAISVFIGAIKRHRLAPGEVGYVLLIASSKDQARVAFDYVVGFLKASPILSQQIEGLYASEVRLKGNIVIGVHAGSYRTIRGRTLLAVVGDETSFWHDEDSAQPDLEIYRACMPALAASNGLWIGISTGYRKIGLLYSKWKEYFGQDSDEVLVIQGASQQFNKTLNAGVIARAKASDPESAEAEWFGGFRSDVAAFLDDRTIEAVIEHGRPWEVPPREGVVYSAFTDPSGGRHDAFTICIGHREGTQNLFFVCDVIRGMHPPFDPHDVVNEYAALCRVS